MTVHTNNITSGAYHGDGIVTQFSYTFRVETAEQLSVYLIDASGTSTLQGQDDDYTVTATGVDGGGLVTFTVAPPVDTRVFIRSNYKLTQLTDFDSQGGFFPDVHEAAFDKLTFLIQQIEDQNSRTLRLSNSNPNGEISPVEGDLTPGAFFRVNGTGDGIDVYSAALSPITSALPVASYAELKLINTNTMTDGNIATVSHRSVVNDGGGGMFAWSSANWAAQVQFDEVTIGEGDGGQYVSPLSNLTGASGAWIRLNDAITLEQYGVQSDRTTDNSRVANLMTRAADDTYLQAGVRHDLDIWEKKHLVDSKTIKSKCMNYSLASLPRVMEKIARHNEDTGAPIVIMGMGSSVGDGAGTDNALTDAPVVKFAEYFSEKFNKLGNLTVNVVNESVGGSGLTDGSMNVDAYLTANNPDIVVLAYGMNDGGVALYNSGQTYPFVEPLTKEIVGKCHAAGADVVVLTTPHPLTTDAITYEFPQSIPIGYPSRSWSLPNQYQYSASQSRITAEVPGSFLDSQWGFGMSAGKRISISGTASNNGIVTISTIDPTGDFITTVEALTDETGTNVSSIARVGIDVETEQVPPASQSTPLIDALGFGAGHEIPVSYRHYRINEAMRTAAVATGVMVIDVERYWFEAVYRHGEANLYDGAEVVHPNQTGHRQSYWYAIYEAIESMAESYAHGVQQNSRLPTASINTDDIGAVLSIKKDAAQPIIMKVEDSSGGHVATLSDTRFDINSSMEFTKGNITVSRTPQGNVEFKETTGELTNVNGSQLFPTIPLQSGRLSLHAINAGLSTHTMLIPYANHFGTLYVGTPSAEVAGPDVSPTILSVTAVGQDISVNLSPNAGTNLFYKFLEVM